MSETDKGGPGGEVRATFLDHPELCIHDWKPVSMVFEAQLLGDSGSVRIRQPDIGSGRVYLVCLRCAQHTYMETSWSGYRLEGSLDRASQEPS